MFHRRQSPAATRRRWGPVAEELSLLTIFVDGCTDFLWEQGSAEPAVHIPHHQHPVGRRREPARSRRPRPGRRPRRFAPRPTPTTAMAATPSTTSWSPTRSWCPAPEGRLRRLAEARHDRLHSADHQDDVVEPRPDRLLSVGAATYVAFYKQALRYGMFKRRQVSRARSRSAWAPQCHRQGPSGRRHRRGSIPNYYFHVSRRAIAGPPTRPSWRSTFKRWNEYPNFQSDGALP